MSIISPRLSRAPILCMQMGKCWPRLAFFVLVEVLLSSSTGCTGVGDYVHNGFKVGPNYQKPPAPVASEWIDSQSKGVNVATADLAGWWSAFNDPKLDRLIE